MRNYRILYITLLLIVVNSTATYANTYNQLERALLSDKKELVTYRDYKSINNKDFIVELNSAFIQLKLDNISDFDFIKGVSVLAKGSELTYKFSYYNKSLEDIQEVQTEYNERVHCIIKELYELGELSTAKTDLENIEALYKYVCDNVEYDYKDRDNTDNQFGYTALFSGKAVCTGYTSLFNKLVNTLGFDTKGVMGYVQETDGTYILHMWSAVLINEEWKQFDTTFDDTNATNFIFFNKSYNEIMLRRLPY